MAGRGNHSRGSSGSGAAAVKIVLLLCVVLVMVAAGSTLFTHRGDPTVESEPPATEAPATPTPPAETVPPATEVPATTEPSAAPTEAVMPPPRDYTPAGIGANMSVTVRASAEVDDSYFSDAVFVGDSRTEGLRMYSGLTNTTFWTKVGLTVSSVFTDRFVKLGEQTLTVAEALEQADYKKVYIMLGINELGWPSEETYASEYAKIIDLIRESHPDATIYVQSIFSMGRIRSSRDEVYNNDNVIRLQRVLCEMCLEKGVNYVNVAEVLQDSDGFLIDNDSVDGAHLTAPYYKVWVDYLKTHTVQ